MPFGGRTMVRLERLEGPLYILISYSSLTNQTLYYDSFFFISTWSLRIYCYKKYSNGDANLRRKRWMYIGEGLNTKKVSLSWNNICLLSWCFYRIDYDKYFVGSKHLMKIVKSKVNLQMNKWKCEIQLCRGAEFHTKVGWIIEEFFIYFGMNTTWISIISTRSGFNSNEQIHQENYRRFENITVNGHIFQLCNYIGYNFAFAWL